MARSTSHIIKAVFRFLLLAQFRSSQFRSSALKAILRFLFLAKFMSSALTSFAKLLYYFQDKWGNLTTWILYLFTYSISISSFDELHPPLMKWISQNSSLANARHSIARTKSKWSMWAQNDADSEDDAETRGFQFKENEQLYWKRQKQKGLQKIKFEPTRGNVVTFYYKGYLIGLCREAKPGTTILTEESEVIWLYSTNRSILQSLIRDVRDLQTSKDDWVQYFRGETEKDVSYWYLLAKEPPRSPSTLVLDGEVLADIVSDIKEYLHPSTEAFYKRIGKPHRRGFLLYGPPGTGKSSLCAVLAGIFCMNIYTLSLNSSNVTESGLVKIFRDLPDHAMIVLEDIDRAWGSVEQSKTDTPSGTGSQARTGISLSALLNVLDGHGAKERRVLFMTTNHRENLDSALTRPGRIDRTFDLGYATEEMIKELFSLFYEPLGVDKDEILGLAGRFASEVPGKIFTAAAIQNFLLQYKDTPEMAISSAADWVEKSRLGEEEPIG
ncbi:uncharacterized protein N7479_001717 [Penicillium vulpinum]|uniref:AAA+ ATPase domain-containing protein n=1 Tax=Penicillium vulpinum TaxID=29845 RepID=A0A1V6R7W7_9EURO|nr:uncharacterized protein N7479_001717 [Penicillium vulpinum]KAJ5971799.1 hypothetical protein N7479_001717 [Penicillium vulpinum]OQD97560.1 hypothetical protein PENVUL_c083G04618 [Penicillium vulpinum]